ncbi:hypothetical protein FORC13_p259 (plasmid) [Bacillus cereus]|nr:hypothetical protein [Bacillus cereus]ALZ64744.1 hypothetical protein FORC13_p259 [Bacillus cereus]
MKRLNISKFLKATPAVVVLSTTLLAGPTSFFCKRGFYQTSSSTGASSIS